VKSQKFYQFYKIKRCSNFIVSLDDFFTVRKILLLAKTCIQQGLRGGNLQE